ncbi:MAG TPA: ABC transporter permease [Vicinamibacterales bacterium]
MIRRRLAVFARSWFRSSQVDEEFTEELQFHIEREAEANRRAGLPPDEALRAARLAVGAVEALREESRDSRPGEWMRELRRDASFTIRTMRRSLGSTVSALLMMALGIGAATSIFSLVDAALLRPLPFPESDRLVQVFQQSPRSRPTQVSLGDVQDWLVQNHSFTAIAGVAAPTPQSIGLGPDGTAELINVQNITAGLFDVLQVTPVAGRTFAAEDTDAARFIVISDRLWRNHFGSDSAVIGRQISLAGSPAFTVIGVIHLQSEISGRADAWTLPPASLGQGEQGRRLHFLDVFARLKTGTSIDDAQSDMAVVAANTARVWPATNGGWGVTIEPLQHAIVSDDLRRTALVLMAGVMFILVMACGNVANLMLAKGVARSSEFAVRAALGGTRARIIRQMLTESFVLASFGALAGLVVAAIVLRAAPSFVPAGTLPPSVALRMDWRVVTFAVAAGCLAALTSALGPAWQGSRTSLIEAIGSGARMSSARGGRVRTVLAVMQVAAAVLLTTGAGLFIRTIWALNNVDAGYQATRVLSATIGLSFQRYAPPNETLHFYQTAEEEVRRLPGVRIASVLSGDLPLDGFTRGQAFEVVGQPPIDFSHQPVAQFLLVTSRYFDALGIRILKGRAFTGDDGADSLPVCIVSEAFARQYLQGRDPLAAQLTIRSMVLRLTDSVPVTRQIVGVARQFKVRPGEAEPLPQIYVPFEQNPWITGKIVVQAATEPEPLIAPIKRVISRIDRSATVTDVRTMDEVAEGATANPRFRAALVTAFASIALSIAGVGLFSVLSFMVRQRAREFSVRMALGARPADVVRLVLSRGAKLGAAGLVTGLLAAVFFVKTLSTLLFGVQPFDPVTFAGTGAVLAALTLVACGAPAALAIRSDPAATLRQE